MKLNLRGWAWAFALALPLQAWANSAFTVKSAVSTQNAYKIVIKSEDKETDLKPGIYAYVGRAKEPKLVLAGDVMDVSESFNGLIAQLEMSSRTNREESFAVIDGKLTLLTNRSSNGAKKSFITFGDNTPVLDGVMMRPFRIEPIKSTEDINIQTFYDTKDSRSELVLVSIRQPSPMGTGVTFAVLVNAEADTSKSTELSLRTPPMIIDYDFLGDDALARLRSECDDSDCVLSRSHLLSLSQHLPSDDRILKQWRDLLAQLANQIKKDSKARNLLVGQEHEIVGDQMFVPPRLDMSRGVLSYEQLPTKVLLEQPYRVVQRMDPNGTKSGVFVGSPDDEFESFDPNARPNVQGQVTFDPKQGKYRVLDLLAVGQGKTEYAAQSETPGVNSLVFMLVDGRPTVAFSSLFSSDKVVTVELPPQAKLENCGKLSGLHTPSKENLENKTGHLVFISFECGKKDRGTYVFLIDEMSNGQMQTVGFHKFATKFMDPVEISKRIWTWTLGKNTIVAFDNIREKAQSQKDMEGGQVDEQAELSGETLNKIPTVPFFNLIASLRAQKDSQVYMTHQDSEAIAYGLNYRRYNPVGAATPWTGFYVRREKDWPDHLHSDRDPDALTHIDGYLLEKPEGNNGKKTKMVITRKLRRNSVTEANLAVVPFSPQDPDKKGGTAPNNINILLYLYDDLSAEHEQALPTLMQLMVKIPFKNLMGGQIVQGRRQAHDKMTLLLFADGENPGVLAIPLRYYEKSEGSTKRWVVSQTEQASWIYKGEFNPSTLKSRIIFDANGAPHWIDQLDMDKFDGKYSVRDLTHEPGTALYVNRPGFRTALRYEETYDDGETAVFSGRSTWHMDFMSEVMGAYKGFKEYWEEKKHSKKKKKKTDSSTLFPDFYSWLEEQTEAQAGKEHQIILLEKDLKDQVMKDILYRYTESRNAKWSMDNLKLGLHYFYAGAGPEAMLTELDRIGRKHDRRDILLGDMGQIIEADDTDPPMTMDKSQIVEEEEEKKKEKGDKKEEAKKDGQETEDEAEEAGDENGEEEAEEEVEEERGGASARDEIARTFGGEVADEHGEKKEEEKGKFDYSRLAYVSLEGAPVNIEAIRNAQDKTERRFPTMIVATPEEWRRAQATFPREDKAGLFKRFKVNARFLTGSWTVWPPNSSRGSDKIKKAAREPISKDEFAIFGELDKLLNSMAEGKEKGKQRILVVPEEIKAYVTNLITTRWATNSKDLVSPWSHRNHQLALFELSNKEEATQETVIDNFESMRGAAHSRNAVLLADMGEVIRMGRPAAKDDDRTFRLRDPLLHGQHNASLIEKSASPEKPAGEGEESDELDRRTIPHALWWLASEGKKIQPKKDKGWTLKHEAQPEVPMLIIATEKEMEVLKQETSFESRFLEIDKHFTVTKLQRPSIEAKNRLVQDLFNRSDIQSLNFEFVHESLPADEARRQLIGLFVGRVDQIARNLKLEPTDAFTRAFVALKRALTEDAELRRNRKLDRFYLERLYTKVFPLPLNFEVLPPNDFLHKFRDPHQASRGLADAGYEGAIELKARNARNIAAQTKGVNDNGRKIPSSQIFFGDTSTGKTYLVETTINYAGLKHYDFDRPNDEEAQALIIKVPEIAPDKQHAKAGQRTVDEVLEHIINFLALPKGHRGVLLFDDLHKTQSKEVWQKLKTFIESLFEAKDGLITVKRLGDGKPFMKVPVRNLILFMTVNPQDDEEIRGKYVRKEDDGDLVGEVMAALNKPGYDPIDRSHFARWTDIIDLSKFPRDAKVPTLLKQLREANAQTYAASPSLVLVTPNTMDEISSGFEDANAREFLSPATYALLDSTKHLPKAPFYIIDRQKMPSRGDHDGDGPAAKGRVRAEDVEAFVKEHTVQYPVTVQNTASKLRLMSFMLDNFRGQLHSGLVLAAQGSDRLASSEELRQNEMLTFLLALIGNMNDFPTVPLRNVIMKPTDFKIRDIEAVRAFEEDVQRLSAKTITPFLRIELQGRPDDEDISLDSFIQGRSNNHVQRKRLDIMMETASKLEKSMEKVFGQYFRIQDMRLTAGPKDWILNMPEEEPKDAFKQLTEELIETYWRFQASLYDHDLEEMQRSQDYVPMGIYDRARLFLLCMDRAITRLPWSHVTQYVVQAMDLASSDLTLSQRTAFQDFLFKSRISPFHTVTVDSVVGLAESMPLVKNFPHDKSLAMQVHFRENCEKFLKIPSNEAKGDQ